MSTEPRVPKRGELWRHYKGGVYEVVELAWHSERNDEHLVIYKDGIGQVWARPMQMWFDEIDGVPRLAFTGMTAERVPLWDTEPRVSLSDESLIAAGVTGWRRKITNEEIAKAVRDTPLTCSSAIVGFIEGPSDD